MWSNFLTVALRNLLRNKAFSLINLFGLALGIACSMLIVLWVFDELSVDAFHNDSERIYSVYTRRFSESEVSAGHYAPGPLAEELKIVVPDIELSTGFDPSPEQAIFQVGEKTLKLTGNYAGEDFFKIFNYPLLQGSAVKALADPDGIAISRKMANTFFEGPEQAIGQILRYNDRRDLLVTAVFEDLPANASEKFDFLLTWKLLYQNIDWISSWEYDRPRTYIKLGEGVDASQVESKIKNLLTNYNKTLNENFRIELGLQRFDQKYLYSAFKNGIPDGGRIEYVRLFTIIAGFILLIACINFMTLSTARAARRAKEVGVRKTAGASRSLLAGQFTGEAILLTFFSTIVGIAVAAAVMPEFNVITQKQIVLPLNQISFWVAMAVVTIVTGVIAGSYPALLLSSLKPAHVMKNEIKFGKAAVLFRKSLVVFQFVLSIVLIVGTIVVSRQITYVQDKHLGFDKENLIYIPFEGDLANKYTYFKQTATQLPGIKEVSRLSRPPSRIVDHGFDLDWKGKDPNAKTIVIHAAAGYDLAKTLDLNVIEGRDFDQKIATDSAGYVINETALQRIGYKDPIGQPLSLFGRPGKIIGVVKDFHFNSLRQPIEPLIIRFGENIGWGFIVVRILPGQTATALEGIERLCKELNPRYPFTFNFGDDLYQSMYVNETVIGKLANSFAALAIFISCLGLLGLIIFIAAQSTKEIGIRKVMGATVFSIVALLSRDFVRLILIATAIAFPAAWWGMNKWLENFAYRVTISWSVFALAGVTAFAIAFLTIGFHAIKAASQNPVKSLRAD